MIDCDIEIKSLADTPWSEIMRAFLDAFAEYSVTFDEAMLADMFKRRGARRELSFAAVADGRIVSFIINGICSYNGNLCAYDTGTGTIKEYRGKGLTDRIFAHSVAPLMAAGVTDYVLEVLSDNHPACEIYRRQGFTIFTEYACYTADNQDVIGRLRRRADSVPVITPATVEQVSALAGFMDFTPSWQNSLASLERNPEAFLCLIAWDGPKPIGFGVSETAYGDITLLAVDPACRRRGVGSNLLLRLVEANGIERAKALNIATDCTSLRSFLEASGFTLSCYQHGMIKHLK
ncbi:MAG: GNAT family N-acetyltransferase [Barnesiella sp.]|nr:GNAT family N-acetyltransferase [Barnesiella sp.]